MALLANFSPFNPSQPSKEHSTSGYSPIAHGEERAVLDRGREVGWGGLASAARYGGDELFVKAAEGWLRSSSG